MRKKSPETSGWNSSQPVEIQVHKKSEIYPAFTLLWAQTAPRGWGRKRKGTPALRVSLRDQNMGPLWGSQGCCRPLASVDQGLWNCSAVACTHVCPKVWHKAADLLTHSSLSAIGPSCTLSEMACMRLTEISHASAVCSTPWISLHAVATHKWYSLCN